MESYDSPQSSGKDPHLWEIAKRRASFKYHLRTYIIVIGFLWAIWFFSGSEPVMTRAKYPWPIWPTAGWGIGLLFHYLGAYVYPREKGAEEEYEKLIRNKKSSN
jgi:hypothetical protein